MEEHSRLQPLSQLCHRPFSDMTMLLLANWLPLLYSFWSFIFFNYSYSHRGSKCGRTCPESLKCTLAGIARRGRQWTSGCVSFASQLCGFIMRTGYRTSNMAAGRLSPMGNPRYCNKNNHWDQEAFSPFTGLQKWTSVKWLIAQLLSNSSFLLNNF